MGTAGNNTCITQIPRDWTLEEAKQKLEQALILWDKEKRKTDSEFLAVKNENELEKEVTTKSEFIDCCKEILLKIGSPLTIPPIIWQMGVVKHLFNSPAFASKIVRSYQKGLTMEENSFVSTNYLEPLREIVKNYSL